jgi:hypothetical protein
MSRALPLLPNVIGSSLTCSDAIILITSRTRSEVEDVVTAVHVGFPESFTNRMHIDYLPIPVSARSKAWVCGRSLAGIAGSNPTGGKRVCLL